MYICSHLMDLTVFFVIVADAFQFDEMIFISFSFCVYFTLVDWFFWLDVVYFLNCFPIETHKSKYEQFYWFLYVG